MCLLQKLRDSTMPSTNLDQCLEIRVQAQFQQLHPGAYVQWSEFSLVFFFQAALTNSSEYTFQVVQPTPSRSLLVISIL